MKSKDLKAVQLMVNGKVKFRGDPNDPELKEKFINACGREIWDAIQWRLEHSHGYEQHVLRAKVQVNYLRKW